MTIVHDALDYSYSALELVEHSDNRVQQQTLLKFVISVGLSIIRAVQVSTEQASSSSSSGSRLSQNKVVLKIELVKAALRIMLLGLNVWEQRLLLFNHGEIIYHYQQQQRLDSLIQLRGGYFTPNLSKEPDPDSVTYRRRQEIVGSRSGRKIVYYEMIKADSNRDDGEDDLVENHTVFLKLLFWTLCGELLHILRPVVYARDTLQTTNSQKSINNNKTGVEMYTWIKCLFMDIVSYRLTMKARSHAGCGQIVACDTTNYRNHKGQEVQAEIRQRRMRWMLYWLRNPIWSILTKPGFERVGLIFLGKRLSSYVVSLISYVQNHHFMLEEEIL